jgi:hypothetical protein
MNWLVVGGGALLVIWLAGRRVAKRDGQPVEPVFGSGESSNAGDGYYGGAGGGDGGLSLSNPLMAPSLAPIGSDIKPAGSDSGSGSLMENFVSAIGFKALEKIDEPIELPEPRKVIESIGTVSLSSGAVPRSAQIQSQPSGLRKLIDSIATVDQSKVAAPSSAQIAASISASTPLGASSLSMSSKPSTSNNDRAVSTAVQAQPPRSFSSVSAAISEKNMMPSIVASPAPQVSRPTVVQSLVASPAPQVSRPTVVQSYPVATAAPRPMPVQQSFVASIRPASISARPSILTNAVRR